MNHPRRLTLLSICVAALALGGCDQGRKVPPDVDVTVVNAAPSFSALDFLRVRRVEANMSFLGVNVFAFDADRYDFNVQLAAPGSGAPANVATFAAELLPDHAYFFVLAEQAGSVDPIVIEQPSFDPASSDTEISVLHAAEQDGAFDVYIEPPGAQLSGATPIATVSFLENSAALTHAAGDFAIYLTPSGDPATVLAQSGLTTFGAGQSNLVVVTNAADQGLADLVIVRASPLSSSVGVDINLQAAVRIVNAIEDRAPRDVYLNGDFSAPLFPAAAFGTVSDYASVPADALELNVTPVGNPGAVEVDLPVGTAQGRISTVLLTGDTDGLGGDNVIEDRRSLSDRAKLQIVNGATLFDLIDVYLLADGQDVTSVLPLTRAQAPIINQFGSIVPGDYQLTVLNTVDRTVLAGPMPITLAAGGFYGMALLNAADAATVDVVLFDDFVN